MSVNASQLNLLVYRHLKENGFHSAAEELHRLTPQGEADTSVSLSDIYKSWLKTSKKKKQKPAKCSSPREKGTTPTKDKLITARKKNNKAVKNPSSSKKSPGKRVKSGEKSAKSVIKAKKPKLDSAGEVAAAGGGDSDSDSSLDVEKWKKLVLQMTEADLAKMESIDALGSSAPKPKKKRVRKPRAKPLPKSASPVQDNESAGMNLKNKEEDAAQTWELKDIFNISRPENTPHLSSGTPHQKKPLSKATHRAATPTVSPKKQPQTENTIIPLPPSEVTTDEIASEPTPKKKGNKTHKDNTDRNAPETDIKVIKEKAVKKTKSAKAATEDDVMEKTTTIAQDISESAVQEKKVKKKKREKENATRDDNTETEAPETGGQVLEEMTGHKVQKIVQKTKGATTEAEEDVTESAVQEKKIKKKKRSEGNSADTAEETKKKKRRIDGKNNSELNCSEELNTEQTVTNTVGNEERLEEKVKRKKVKRKTEMAICEEHLEQEAVEVQTNAERSVEDGENPERTVKKKKAKKKSVDDEENPEEEAREIKTKQKNPDEDISEQTVEETKKAGHKKVRSKDNISTPQTANCKKPEDLEHLSDTDLMELQSQETSPHKKKKKKKSKLTSDEVPDEAAVFAQDVTTTQTTPADSHRKKRKSTHTES
ncbi:nucleolar and coiled-body phosphoprotein 1 [Nematolebias whitei]|uniref:nucleolar and coiled-body phosphoprotein 1 n=1 Tax=Nematolebias whitei TaxID=451745 RepID=UPI001898C366|nr:nucleolar and coiled-body phosphoprotein 1 [Nematolebias whitei]